MDYARPAAGLPALQQSNGLLGGSCLQRMGRQRAYTGPGWTMLGQAHCLTVYRGPVYALDGMGAHPEYGPQLGRLA
jgi:glucokinase